MCWYYITFGPLLLPDYIKAVRTRLLVLWVCATGMARQVTSKGQQTLFLLLLLLAAVSESSAFQTHYEAGNTYVYSFEGGTTTSLPGQQGDGVKLHLKAKAEVSFGDACEAVLKLKDVQVTGPDAQKFTHLNDLESHPVSFSFENGVVGGHICANGHDSEASLNLKRAILAHFQVAPQETARSGKSVVLDVFGLCPTDYSYTERGGTTTITKSRNLNKCHLREHLRQDFASVTYHVESDLQNSPLMESTQEFKHQLQGGVLRVSESHEKYLYRPFANQDAGAKTVVDSKLTYVGHNKKTAPAVSGAEQQSIIFHPPNVHPGSGSAASVVDALHKAHQAMPEYVGENAAKEFANVVRVVRHTSKNDLLSVYNQVKSGAGFKDKSAGTKMFLDALFRAGTGDAVEVAVELLKSNKITGPHAEFYYLQLAYTRHVTKAALLAAVTLLEQPNPSKLAYLGVGALAGRYCSEHRCDGVAEVDEFLEKLSLLLNGGCKVSNYDEEVKIVATLKALQNAHHLNDAVTSKLQTCLLDDGVPTRIRSAVLDVFQSDACKNYQLDSELRIKAFLALVECPCNKKANDLKELLDKEPSYQVGSFIVSYLRNLRASANPSKEKQKAVFGEIRTTKRFPIDFRKFSNNFEFSYLLGGANVGTTVESNVIYSQNSFLPRATTLNLTTEFFGHSVNLLEDLIRYLYIIFIPEKKVTAYYVLVDCQVELRQENLDLLAEGLFGPKGYFNTHTAAEVVQKGKEHWTDVENTAKQRFNHAIRGKRSVTKEQLELVKSKSVSPYHSETDRELLLELSTRLFGAEVGWLALHHNARDAAKNAFDTTFNLLDKVMKKAKDFDYKLRQHNTFLDTELVYPTSLGFPLKLVLAGSSAVHVELEGKVDVHDLVHNLKNSHVHFRFVPSAAVEFVGAFVVDAYAVEAGLKVAATLHTATGSDITVKATEDVGVDVTVGLPVQKQDIVTLKTEVLTTVQEKGKPEVNTEISLPGTPRRDYHGCFDQLSPLVGLTFCTTMSFPWDPVASKAAFYPLNGPSKFSLVVENEDVTSYHFRASLNKADPHKKSLELLLETPGSKTERKLGLILERTYDPYHGVKAQLNSPWKQVSAELAFTDNDKELSLLAKVTNDEQEYYVKLGASVTGDPNHATYHPLLEYKTPERKSSLVSKKGAKGAPEKLTHQFNVAGSVTVDKTANSKKYTFNDVVFTTPQGQYKVDGTVTSEGPTAFSTDLKVYYGENHVVLKSGFKRPSANNFNVHANVQPSQYPDFGVNLIWNHKRDKNNFGNSLAVVHGRDPNSEEARFTLNQEAHYQFDSIHKFEFASKNKVTYPLLGIIGKLDASVQPKTFHLDVEASYEKHKFEAELNANHGQQHTGDYDVKFHAKVLDNSLEFETKRVIVSEGKSKFTTELQVHPGGKYEAVADVTHVFERNNIDFQIDAEAKIHGQPDPYKLDSGLVYNPQLFDAHHKINVGAENYVDVSVNFKRGSGGNPSGNAKVFLKNYLVGNAQFKYTNGEGSATLNVDVPKLGRKLKGTGDLHVKGSQHVATVELYYNAEKKLAFHTDTDLKKDSLDSKNVLSILNYKTEVNVKGTLQGKLEDGQLKGEFDATLPNGYNFAGKLDQTLHVRPSNSDGDVKAELSATAPSGAPVKVMLEFAAKNVDTKQYSFDGQSRFAYHSPSGKDLALIIAAKNIPQREQRVVEVQGVLQGSLVGDPIRVEFNSEAYEPHVTYKGHGSYGSAAVVDLKGKVSRTLKFHDHHYTGPFSVDNVLEFKLPSDKVKHIKMESHLQGELAEKKLQFTYSESLDLDDKTYKLSLESNNELEKGSNKLILVLPNKEPATYVNSWYFNYDDYRSKDVLKGGLTLTRNENAKFSIDVSGKKDYSDLDVHAKLDTPYEKLKHAELSLKNKYVPAPRLEVDTDFSLTVDDKKLAVVNKLTPGPFAGFPNIDFTATHPEGKTRVYVHLTSHKKNEVSGKAELEWPTNGGGKLTSSGKASYESFQNFRVEADIESAKLNLKKWHVLLANKPQAKGSSSKTLQIQATEAGQPVINGRQVLFVGPIKLEFHVEDKENTYKAGVSGNVQVRSQSQPLKADVFFNKFNPTDNGELGAEVGITIHLGDKSFDALSKHTNKESRASVSVYFNHLEHDFGAKFDFKACGVNEGFVLTGKNVRQPLSFDHAVELKLLNEKHTTYNFHSYLNEKALGVILTLPQRIIALEGKLGYDKEKGERKVDLGFWLDKKKQPDNKAAVHLLVAVKASKEGTTFHGDAKFSHPALNKEFSVTGKGIALQDDTLLDASVDLDIFAKKNQKITLVAKLERIPISHGYNVTGHLSAKGKQNIDLSMVPQLIDVSLDGGAALSADGASYISTLAYQDEKHKSKSAQIQVVIHLDEQYIYELAKHDGEEFIKQVKVVSNDFGNEVSDELQGLLETLKKAQPDVKEVVSSYQTQLKALREELENDEGFTGASENVKKVVQAVTKVVLELTNKATELADQFLEVVTKLKAALHDSASKLVPKVKDLYSKSVEFTTSVVSAVLEHASRNILKIADFVKEHEEELKKVVEVVKDFIEDVGKIIGTTVVQVRNEVVGFFKVLLEQLKALPIVANFKEQYSHFVSQLSQHLVPEQTWSIIKEVVGPFKDSLPTVELRELVEAAEQYVEKHIQRETVNDAEELQALLNKATKALKSLLAYVSTYVPGGDATKNAPNFLGLRFPVAVRALAEFPKTLAFRFSPLHFLASRDLRDLPTLEEFLLTLKPTLNPLDWVPPFKAHGVLIDMNHFITLDGRHFTFKGQCAYILISDIVDGNFSVSLDFATRSLFIADHTDSIELFHDSTVKGNGQPVEFPYESGDLVAWKDFSAVHVLHRAGLHVKCDPKHSYCLFFVNGYYFGKTRGLLGALDYEPFNDFKEPNGQVVTNVNNFGNSWKVNDGCADVSGATHHDHHMPEPAECASVFGGSSPLKVGYLFSPVAPFREACSHFVADESTPDAKKTAACRTAAAYVASVRTQYLPLYLPKECVHCKVVGGGHLEVGSTVSVRVPQTQADVVIVVEQVTANSELFNNLVTPLVSQLTTELKAKGINDVHFTLIGYGEATHNYPTVYTTSGKPIFEGNVASFKETDFSISLPLGKTKNIKFVDPEDPFSLKLDTCANQLKYLKAVVESELGLGPPSRAYQFASKYPFKVGTSKVLIGVVGTTKPSAFTFSNEMYSIFVTQLQQLGALYSTHVLRERGVAFHLVAPVKDLQLKDTDPKVLKSIVGFDNERVYALSDARKKKGSTELHKVLSYENNIWIPIALDSYGTAYVAQNFIEAKQTAREQFLQVLSHRVSESLLAPLHEDCTCRLVDGLHPFSECKVTGRVEREQLAPFVKGKGVKG
ncbi:Apolipophorin [Blattella germanica]|nr:Apolipophorin [Blattella germanica]